MKKLAKLTKNMKCFALLTAMVGGALLLSGCVAYGGPGPGPGYRHYNYHYHYHYHYYHHYQRSNLK